MTLAVKGDESARVVAFSAEGTARDVLAAHALSRAGVDVLRSGSNCFWRGESAEAKLGVVAVTPWVLLATCKSQKQTLKPRFCDECKCFNKIHVQIIDEQVS